MRLVWSDHPAADPTHTPQTWQSDRLEAVLTRLELAAAEQCSEAGWGG